MKKSILAILILTFILTLSACGGNEVKEPDTSSIVANTNVGPHTHAYGEWTTVTAATCTEGGTEERVCSCGEKESKTIEATGHNEVKDAAYAATCAKEGKTAGSHCSKCNEVFVAQKTIAKLPHTEVEIPLVRATCKAEGKTKGKQCSVCKEITKAQKTVEKDEHTFGDWSIVKYATDSKEGERKHTCTVCNTTETGVIDIRNYDTTHGSAKHFQDTTVIVSVFANDATTSWDLNSKEDKETMDIMYDHLQSAAIWLETQGAFYSADTKFIYDWKANPDLYYTCDFSDVNMISQSGSNSLPVQRAYFEKNINSEDLMQKYNAQNIIFMVYFDVPANNTVRSWCSYKSPNSNYNKVEVINIFNRQSWGESFYYAPAATFAHEILHAFGAPDLYYKSNRIPQEYVDYLGEIKSSDILFTVNLGKSVSVHFSELCAYYVGLKDTSSEVEHWNLGKSHFVTE